MTLSIRARITFFFTAIFSVLLLIAFVSLYFGHQHSRLAQIDENLVRTEALVSKLISTDLDEATPLATAATEALEELALPGLSVSVFDARGLAVAGDAGRNATDVSSPPGPITEETSPGNTRRYRARHGHPRGTYQIAVSHSLEALEGELASLRRALAGSLAFSLSLAIALGFWFAGGALRPVTTMAAQARTMTGETEGSRLSSSGRSDELGELARAFNGLLERVESTLAQQRRFMADASHELRTPVSVARTAIEVTLAKPNRADAEYRECLSIVKEQMRRLSRIVEDLFALARADAAPLPIELRRFYLDELVAACVKDANLLAASRGTTVECGGPEDLEVSGDERLLGQMMSNLLDNAIRHGPPRGRVRVDLSATGQAYEIAIRDSNAVVAEAERERIFERFVRLDPARTGEGAGLGLAIARAIAVAHGGTLVLRSGDLGNTFVASLPGGSEGINAPPDRGRRAPFRLP